MSRAREVLFSIEVTKVTEKFDVEALFNFYRKATPKQIEDVEKSLVSMGAGDKDKVEKIIKKVTGG